MLRNSPTILRNAGKGERGKEVVNPKRSESSGSREGDPLPVGQFRLPGQVAAAGQQQSSESKKNSAASTLFEVDLDGKPNVLADMR